MTHKINLEIYDKHIGRGGGIPIPKVVITEDLWWAVPDWFVDQYEVEYQPGMYQDMKQLQAVAETADALVIRNKTRIDAHLLDRCKNVQIVGRLGVGLDNIDLKCCRQRGVHVVAARGSNANSVAEYVMAAMFEHARYLSVCDAHTRAGGWDRQHGMGRELGGKTLGLLGVGDIGQRVAVRARAFGMRVVAYDPFLLPSSMLVQDFDVQLTDMEEVFCASDYLSIHVPLTPQTYHMIDAKALERMKPGVVLINTARGGIVNEEDLFVSLQQNPNRYAILDVREQEPPKADDPLRSLANIRMTPHIAGITQESSQRVAEFILTEVHHALTGQSVLGLIV